MIRLSRFSYISGSLSIGFALAGLGVNLYQGNYVVAFWQGMFVIAMLGFILSCKSKDFWYDQLRETQAAYLEHLKADFKFPPVFAPGKRPRKARES